MTGPLVDPFPWTEVGTVERHYTRSDFQRLLERFLVAEELIRQRDLARMAGSGNSTYIRELEARYDQLEPRYRIPLPRTVVQVGANIHFPDWVAESVRQ